MRLFVWDLHGTLEQGNENAALEASNIIMQQYGYPQRFSPSDGRQLYGLRWYEYFEFLLPTEPHERHVELQVAAFHYSNSPAGALLIAKHIQPSKHAIAVLDAIQASHQQIIISNTTPESLPFYLNQLGISGYFADGRALAVNQHVREVKRTKADALKDYLKGKHFDSIIVIGDSDGDMKLAEAVNATAYLYAHPGWTFRSQKGHYKIQDLRKLLVEI